MGPKELIFCLSSSPLSLSLPPVISPSSSSVSGNYITASLLAQSRHLGIILRALFLPAFLTQAGTSHLYSSYYVHLPILLECCCQTLNIVLLWHSPVSPFPNLTSCQCFQFRVLFLNVSLSMLSLYSKFASGSISQDKVHHPHLGTYVLTAPATCPPVRPSHPFAYFSLPAYPPPATVKVFWVPEQVKLF